MRLTRRTVLLAAAAAVGGALPSWAKRRGGLTPPGFEGPFYPTEWPRVPTDFTGPDDDADLVWVNGRTTFAEGTILLLEGRVLDPAGGPLPNIDVEIWQVDNRGRYHHPGDTNLAALDPSFRGRGHMVTDGAGTYRFRTIKPVPYPGRTLHIHFKLKDTCSPDLLTTQLYFAGESGNATDALYQAIPEGERGRVTVRLRKSRRSKVQGKHREVLRATFDLVLGVTPCDPAS
jgi:protocatechuate 3,4-dioxygenase beta subunit